MTDATTTPDPGPRKKRKRQRTPELSTRKRKYAALRAAGKSLGEAGKAVGLKDRRAAWTWERQDPRIKVLIAKILEREMPTNEILARLAAQARGDLPTKTTRKGNQDRHVFDMHSALFTLARIRGQFRDDAPPLPPTMGAGLGSGEGAFVLTMPLDKLARLATVAAKMLEQQAPALAPPAALTPDLRATP